MKILICKFFLNFWYILICYGGYPYHAAYVVAIFTGGSFVTQEVYADDTDSLRRKVKGDFRIYKDLESFFDGSIECMKNKKAQIIILKPATESNFSNIFTFEPVIRKTRQSTLLMYESMEVDEEAPVVAGAEAMLHWPLHYSQDALNNDTKMNLVG